jgi:type II secretory pathway pseudopilin PulG
MNREHGFILVEIITILLIVGILVNVWLPNYYAIKKKAQAARIIGDFLVIRDAVTMYHSDYGVWPASSDWGRSPAGLGMFMPVGFSWDLNPDLDVRYSWEHLPVSALEDRTGGGITGVSVYSEDNALLRALAGIYSGRMVLAKGFQDTRRVILLLNANGRKSDG